MTSSVQFDVVDVDELSNILFKEKYTVNREINRSFTQCDICNKPMAHVPAGLECTECHQFKQIIGELRDCKVESSGILKTTMSGQKSVYTSVPDNSKSQKKQILDQLVKLNSEYEDGPKFPKNILEATACGYNEVQKLIIDTYDDCGNVVGSKKFVKRGSIKDETLGAWLYYTCINSGISRKKRDIASFMQLSSQGISRGDTILRGLHTTGKIVIPAYADPSKDFAKRYLEALKIGYDEFGDPTPQLANYKGFIDEIVATCVKLQIANNSIESSKIVGTIWVIINKQKLNISATEVENSCDHTRKNTFTRFSKAVDDNIGHLIPIFEKYGINVGFRYRLKSQPSLRSD